MNRLHVVGHKIYDNLSRIIEEKVLAKSIIMCYTYDNLNRVIKRTVKNLCNVVLSEETFTYAAAGNIYYLGEPKWQKRKYLVFLA